MACAWHWGAVAPWFNGAAALPTEREGKAAGWRQLKLVVVCVVLCVVRFVLCCVSARITILFCPFCNHPCQYFAPLYHNN